MPITAPVVVFPDSTPTDATSPDGHIRAVVDDQYGGVLLIVDYTLSDVKLNQPLSSPFACTLYRQLPDGTVDTVRGGNPYKNYGAMGRLYDQEVPLDTLVTYWAVPTLADGTQGPPCAGVQVQTSAPYPGMWLTSPYDLSLALNCGAQDGRKGTYASRNDDQIVLGSPYPATTLQTRAALTTTMTFFTNTEAQFKAAKKLFDLNVIQRRSLYWERPDGWFTVGDVGVEPATGIMTGWMLWTIPLVERERPSTTGQFVSIPGDTFKDRLAEYPTFASVISRQFSGNLISENDSEFETSVAWTAVPSNTTVSQDAANFRRGAHSMKLVATAAGAVGSISPKNYPVTPGGVYEFTAWAFSAQGGRNVQFEIDWKDSANNYLGFVQSTPVQLGTLSWTKIKFLATVPAGANFATLLSEGTALHAADSFNFDVLTFGEKP